ncbi:MAG: hypothetical protein ACKVT1_15765 [Dehalococcoidia bacterium]
MDGILARLPAACTADGEFRLAARYWTGTLRLDLGDEAADLQIDDGTVSAVGPASGALPAGTGNVGLRAPAATWAKILAAVPPPMFNDVMPARAAGMELLGDTESFWQYYPAVRRTVDLLRIERNREATDGSSLR